MGSSVVESGMTTQAEVRQFILSHPGMAAGKIAAALGCNPGFVSKVVAIYKLKLGKTK